MGLSVAYKFASTFMSKGSMEKLRIHRVRLGERQHAAERPSACPFAKQLMGESVEDLLPTFLGGRRVVEEDLYPATVRSGAELSQFFASRSRREPLALAGLPLLTRADADLDDDEEFLDAAEEIFMDDAEDFYDIEEADLEQIIALQDTST